VVSPDAIKVNSVRRPLNVLVVNPFDEAISGNDEVLVRVMEKMDRDRFKFVVVQPGDNPYAERYRSMGAEVVFMRMSIIKRSLKTAYLARYAADFLPTVYRFGRLCRKYKIDIVHTNTTQILGAGPAARLLRLPSIYHVHSVSIIKPEWVVRLLSLWFRATADMMIANSPVTAAIFTDRGFPEKKMKVVWNPVDVDAFSSEFASEDFRYEIGVEHDTPLVGIVGRVARIKCIEHFLRACALLADRFESALFPVVGGANTEEDKMYLKELEELTRSLGLEGRVVFTGRRTDISNIMRSLTVLGHSCLYEGFGLVIAEAMAAGVPVVAAATGAAPEIIDDDRTGYLVPFGDHSKMAEAIALLLDNPEKSKKMGEAGREKANRLWRARHIADSIAQVYLKLAGAGSEKLSKRAAS